MGDDTSASRVLKLHFVAWRQGDVPAAVMKQLSNRKELRQELSK